MPELFLWRLTEQFVHKEGIDDFGLLAATLTPLWKSEPELTGLLQSLPTLWIALKTFFRLAKQFSSLVRFQIVREGDVALLQFIHAPGLPAEDQGELYDVKILPSRR